MKSICNYCNKEYEKKKSSKFCSSKCCGNWHYHNNPERNMQVKMKAREYYEKHKDSPRYKEMQRARFDRWLEKNRERFLESVRKSNRERQQKLRTEWKEKGLCSGCGAERTDLNFTWCEKCREKHRERYRKRKQIIK